MTLSIHAFYRLIIHALVLLAAAFTLGKIDLLSGEIKILIDYLPYLSFIVAIGLSIQFNRCRFFTAALALSISFYLIQNFLQASLLKPSAFYIFTLISLLLPVNLLIISLYPERGLWNRYGLLLLSAIPLQLLIAYVSYDALILKLATFSLWLAIKPIDGYILSLAATSTFVISLLGSLLLLIWRDNETEAALVACLFTSFFTLAFFHQPLISTVLFFSAGLCLIIGVVRSSYEMAYHDDLTGLLGRRALNEKLRGLRKNYVVAMMDIDHFKKFNDNHGHDVGDDVLKIVAMNIGKITGGGTAYRYGGEEFCIIFPGKKLKDCKPHLEAVRENIADYDIVLRNKMTRPKKPGEGKNKRGKAIKQKTVSVTISIGVAEQNEHLSTPESVIKAADKTLYQAKNNGRNCLVGA